ncbi:MAG: hypothetical protein ACK5YO_02580, partial [Planctomyces sp.]
MASRSLRYDRMKFLGKCFSAALCGVSILAAGCSGQTAEPAGGDRPAVEDSADQPPAPSAASRRSSAPPPPVISPDDTSQSSGGSFSDVAASLGVEFRYFEDRVPGRFLLPEVMGGGVAWIDVDLDGWQDLY